MEDDSDSDGDLWRSWTHWVVMNLFHKSSVLAALLQLKIPLWRQEMIASVTNLIWPCLQFKKAWGPNFVLVKIFIYKINRKSCIILFRLLLICDYIYEVCYGYSSPSSPCLWHCCADKLVAVNTGHCLKTFLAIVREEIMHPQIFTRQFPLRLSYHLDIFPQFIPTLTPTLVLTQICPLTMT